jgi:hypothetical protein
MEMSERSVSRHHHVVDWQLMGTTENHQYDGRDLRVRIGLLEAQANRLSALVLENPEATTKREALGVLDREIAGLRAVLAWAGGALD